MRLQIFGFAKSKLYHKGNDQYETNSRYWWIMIWLHINSSWNGGYIIRSILLSTASDFSDPNSQWAGSHGSIKIGKFVIAA